jgi:transposase-like protein
MDTSQAHPEVAQPAKRGWRRHSDEFKSRVIELARQGGGSVAAVALANGLNANMLRRWVRESEMGAVAPLGPSTQAAMTAPAFVPVTLADRDNHATAAPLPTAAAQPPSLLAVEIRRGAISVTASLPMDARSAAWLREVLV